PILTQTHPNLLKFEQAHYKTQLDPTVEEVKKLCTTCRKYDKWKSSDKCTLILTEGVSAKALAGMYVLSNVASGNEFHKEAVMDQLFPQIGDNIQSIMIKLLQSNDSRLRTACVWTVVNLTFPSSPGAHSRVAKLQNACITSQLKDMVNDPCRDVKVRQMSVVQIEHSETMERGKPKPGGLSDPRLVPSPPSAPSTPHVSPGGTCYPRSIGQWMKTRTRFVLAIKERHPHGSKGSLLASQDGFMELGCCQSTYRSIIPKKARLAAALLDSDTKTDTSLTPLVTRHCRSQGTLSERAPSPAPSFAGGGSVVKRRVLVDLEAEAFRASDALETPREKIEAKSLMEVKMEVGASGTPTTAAEPSASVVARAKKRRREAGKAVVGEASEDPAEGEAFEK
ncbi:hypothetical protein HYC85_001013, partial [Camellia sinensis]